MPRFEQQPQNAKTGGGNPSGQSGLFAAAAAMSFAVHISHLGREELVGREIDFREQLAGIIRCGRAFFLRDAEVIRRNQHLHIALNLYNCKNTDGRVNVP